MTPVNQNPYRLLLLLLAVLAACAPVAPVGTSAPSPTDPPAATIEIPLTQALPTSAITPTCETAPTSEAVEILPGIHYQLDASLNYPDHSLTIIETVDYTNLSGTELSDLPLIVPPDTQPEVFSLVSLQMDPGFSQSTAGMEGHLIRIHLSPALMPEQHLTLTLIFQLQVPQQRSAFGYTDRQLLLADWYAFIPPYLEDAGWLINDPGIVGEYLAYPLADFTVNLHLSPPMESLTVAASAPLASQEGNCRRYAAHQVRNFSLAISPEYELFVSETEQATIQSYTFPEHEERAARAASLAQNAWGLYSTTYTENPRTFMSVVEADIADGLECDGVFFLSDWYYASADETPQNYFELLVVHETAHQWFYGLAPNDQAHEPWLDETLATYSELLYLEAYHPDLVDWWWGFRVHSFSPSGAVNATIYDFTDSRPYINAVYLRGVSFLQEVREAIGDDLFFTFLQNYAQQDEADRFRTTDQFFYLLGSITETDLSHLRAVYFR